MVKAPLIQIDDWTIWPLSDGYFDLDLDRFVGVNFSEVYQNFLKSGGICLDGYKVRIQVRGYLIDTKEHLILIDTGRGNKGAASAGFLEKSLLNTGHHPHQISHVLLTHFHPDHIGGLLNSTEKPAFPNATIFVSTVEASYWLDPGEEALSTALNQPRFAFAKFVLAPYLAQGKVRYFQSGEEILRGIIAVESFGHTPGHTAFLAKKQILFWGDIVHIAELQFTHLEWYVVDDINGAQAVLSRKRILSQVVDQNLIVAGAHLPHLGLGTVSRVGNVFSWNPIL